MFDDTLRSSKVAEYVEFSAYFDGFLPLVFTKFTIVGVTEGDEVRAD